MLRMLFVVPMTLAGIASAVSSFILFLRGNGMGPVEYPDRPELRTVSFLMFLSAMGLLAMAVIVFEVPRSKK